MDQELIKQFPEAQLTMRDRLPYTYLVSRMISTIMQAVLNANLTVEQLREAVQVYVNMIPKQLRDEEFIKDLMQATVKMEVDARPKWCGYSIDVETCREMKIPLTVQVITFDYMKVFNACFNLLQRRHMLLHTERKEIFTGRKAQKKTSFYTPEDLKKSE